MSVVLVINTEAKYFLYSIILIIIIKLFTIGRMFEGKFFSLHASQNYFRMCLSLYEYGCKPGGLSRRCLLVELAFVQLYLQRRGIIAFGIAAMRWSTVEHC